MNKVYRPLKDKQKVFIKNFYLYQNEKQNKLSALITISTINNKAYFVDFDNVEIDGKDYEKYLENGPQIWSIDEVSWYWTKKMLDYLDATVKDSKLELIKLNNLDELVNYEIKPVKMFEIDKDEFKQNVGFVTEVYNEDYLEFLSKIDELNKTQKVFSKELSKDVEESKVWMLQTLYDND